MLSLFQRQKASIHKVDRLPSFYYTLLIFYSEIRYLHEIIDCFLQRNSQLSLHFDQLRAFISNAIAFNASQIGSDKYNNILQSQNNRY